MVGRFFYDNAVACWVYNKQTLQIVDVNRKSLNMYGYTDYEFTSCIDVCDLAPGKCRKSFNNYLKYNANANPMIHPQIKKDGTPFHAMVIAQSVQFGGEDCALVMVIDSNDLSFDPSVFADFAPISGNRALASLNRGQLN